MNTILEQKAYSVNPIWRLARLPDGGDACVSKSVNLRINSLCLDAKDGTQQMLNGTWLGSPAVTEKELREAGSSH